MRFFCCGRPGDKRKQIDSRPMELHTTVMLRSNTVDNQRDGREEFQFKHVRRAKRSSTTFAKKKKHPLADYVYPRNPQIVRLN